ncbi:hypothetical protein HYFRA_00011278 [Hymenoscyphus fraxineus]|uniref:FAD/NAD(P)-binding domain-containing protein n=1 Tax=Hymenoscyphus fraxineus TaxID=746836 RepID=A0A9N9PQ22_9HELO|nr:hypothetical protein HYFRA_00011278 [Hymenoscyphus fraxineus]
MGAFKTVVTYSLLSLAAFVTATPVSKRTIPATDYDVVIVGGGPSGLSALSGLSRVRRNSLLIDSGTYRNLNTRHINDVIGLDGIAPWEFRARVHQQLAQYPGANMKNGTITSITKEGEIFTSTDAEGNVYTSRKIVLATGVVDVLPDTPGVKENFARGIYWCPWCDGWEHRDQPFGILGSIVDVLGAVEEVITINKDIIAFVNGTQTDANIAALNEKSPGWDVKLAKYGVQIENRTITAIERVQDGGGINRNETTDEEFDLFNVVLEDGQKVSRSAFITNFKTKQQSYLGLGLGVQYYSEKMDVITGTTETAAPGVFAVGDGNSDNSTNVPHAMWTGKRAAVKIHIELEKEYSATLVQKRDEMELLDIMGRDVEDLWESTFQKN